MNHKIMALLFTAMFVLGTAPFAKAAGITLWIYNWTDVPVAVSSSVNPEFAGNNIPCSDPSENSWLRLKIVQPEVARSASDGTPEMELKPHPCNTRVRILLSGKGGNVLDPDDKRWLQVTSPFGKVKEGWPSRKFTKGSMVDWVDRVFWCWIDVTNNLIYTAEGSVNSGRYGALLTVRLESFDRNKKFAPDYETALKKVTCGEG